MRENILNFYKGMLPEEAVTDRITLDKITINCNPTNARSAAKLKQNSKYLMHYLVSIRFQENSDRIFTSIYKIMEELGLTHQEVYKSIIELQEKQIVQVKGSQLLEFYSFSL